MKVRAKRRENLGAMKFCLGVKSCRGYSLDTKYAERKRH